MISCYSSVCLILKPACCCTYRLANILKLQSRRFKNKNISTNFSFITNSFENDVSASIQALILDFTADELTNKGNIQADNLNIYSTVVVNNRGSLRANNFSFT